MVRRFPLRLPQRAGLVAAIVLLIGEATVLIESTGIRVPHIDWRIVTRLDLIPEAVGVAIAGNIVIVWRLLHPASFRRIFVAPRQRRKLLRWYGDRYFPVLGACGLARQRNGVATTASLLRVELGPLADRLPPTQRGSNWLMVTHLPRSSDHYRSP